MPDETNQEDAKQPEGEDKETSKETSESKAKTSETKKTTKSKSTTTKSEIDDGGAVLEANLRCHASYREGQSFVARFREDDNEGRTVTLQLKSEEDGKLIKDIAKGDVVLTLSKR